MQNIYNFYQKMSALASSSGFKKFYSDLSDDWYKELSEGYKNREHEEELVRRLVNSAKNRSYEDINLYSKFIHGAKSQVKFNYKGNETQRELGDMAIITIVSDKKERLFQRLCFIQNKVGKKRLRSTSWSIDQAQLHILKHFPPLTGVTGIIPKGTTVNFANFSDCLGAYGLFKYPGEMIFASAILSHLYQKGKKSINSKNIIDPSIYRINNSILPYLLVKYPLRKFLTNFSYPYIYNYNHAQFLGNVIFTQDLYSLSKNWIHVNIGEFTLFNGQVLDNTADAVANSMIQEVGLSEKINIPSKDTISVDFEDSSFGIMALHIDISKEG